MDESTRFLLERMEEHRCEQKKDNLALQEELKKLDEKMNSLTGFKNRVIGLAVGAGWLGSILVEMILRK